MRTIKEVYGFEYRSDWHHDLDGLTGQNHTSLYLQKNSGLFIACTTEGGGLIGTGGFYRMNDDLKQRLNLGARYNETDLVVVVSRLYVKKDQRRVGIGRMILSTLEKHAREAACDVMYLHANSDNIGTIKFWKDQGFSAFGKLDFSTNFDKNICSASAS